MADRNGGCPNGRLHVTYVGKLQEAFRDRNGCLRSMPWIDYMSDYWCHFLQKASFRFQALFKQDLGNGWVIMTIIKSVRQAFDLLVHLFTALAFRVKIPIP
jgi:hypothetical protein